MNIYYTENPMREFKAESDEQALAKTNASFVYRESDTPNGLPFIVLREVK